MRSNIKNEIGSVEIPSIVPDLYHPGAFLSNVQGKAKKIRGSRTAQWRTLTVGLIVLDIIMTMIAFRLAYLIRFELSLPVFKEDVIADFSYYRNLSVIFIPVLLGIFAAKGLYNRQHLLGGTQEYALLFDAISIWGLLVIATGFIQPKFILARGWLLASWLLIFFFVALGRFNARRLIYTLRHLGYFLTPAVIVGANNEGIMLATQLLQWKTSGFQILGFVDKKLETDDQVIGSLRCLGNVDDLEDIIVKYQAEELILASSAFSVRDHMIDIFRRYGIDDKVKVRFSSGLYEVITTGLTVKDFAYVPLVGINPVRLTGIDKVLKTILDYGLVIPGLIAISPFLLIIAIAIKLDSPGPIIYRRRVMGVGGHQFDAFKFRTMHVNGNDILDDYPQLKEELARNHKLKHDPRVTQIGSFLRKLSLDELPQLLNVIRGEMSLVGPRMISPPEIDNYDRWDLNLLTVRPGLTGLWQVSGRSDVSYEERVRLDMHYIRNWSIWLDLQLLFQTLPAVIKRRGAY